MRRFSFPSAFSLIELLVALSVLAIVATLIVPRFLSLQDQASSVVAKQMAADLNSVYGNWVANGGAIGSTPSAADLLWVLSQPSGGNAAVPAHDGFTAISDGGNSSSIRTSLPADVVAAVNLATQTANSFVLTNDKAFTFNASTSTFYVGRTNAAYDPSTLFGDVTGDGHVYAEDWTIARGALGSTSSSPNFRKVLDYDSNGLINNLDLAHVQANLGK